jgi:hypothetical protein
MKHLTFSFSLILILSACIYDECPDEVAHDFTQTELDWFSFEPGDTVFYKDAENGEIHYMTGTSQEFTTERTFNGEHNCINEGYYDISYVMNNKLTTDFPHYTNDFTKIDMHVVTLGLNTSMIDISLNSIRDIPNSYTYHLFMENNTELVRASSDPNIASEIEFYSSLSINGKSYSNVFVIGFRADDELNFAFYDTLYFSKDGFLKFISSQYGNRLEIME